MMHSSEKRNRRQFLATSAAAAGVAIAGNGQLPAARAYAIEETSPPFRVPRWRGFNLLDFFQAFWRPAENGRPKIEAVPEEDCVWIAEFGFDFVRLPMDYWLWIDSDWPTSKKLRPDDVFKIRESTLELIDQSVERCRKHGLHIQLNFHRAPGYCINDPEREPFVLWKDELAQRAFVSHWEMFAKRYRGIPNEVLSFNLVNEAPGPREGYMTADDYCRIMKQAVDAIRAVSPDRLIFADGLSVGTRVAECLIPTGIAQSVHAYHPAQISHYRASWVDRDSSFPTPTWPLRNPDGTIRIGRQQLEQYFAPWGELRRSGIGVHCGETGCFNKTPYEVFIAWMEDILDILKSHDIGYALWNFRGSFGVLDSGRADIEYEDWRGHKLDRRLLQLLQRY
ncbi:MAG: glycoside hydrolase family 5 protein [Thermogutta sp.]